MQFLGRERQHTTAYHPAANGLVARFHRQPEASLMARNSGADWVDRLPFILLCIRTTIKTDLDTCPTELVYGSTLRLPSEIVTTISELHPSDMNNLFQRLRQRVYGLQATPTRPQTPTSYVDPRLKHCTRVFIKCD